MTTEAVEAVKLEIVCAVAGCGWKGAWAGCNKLACADIATIHVCPKCGGEHFVEPEVTEEGP